jgi:ABC-type multidrug transport system permease subunit
VDPTSGSLGITLTRHNGMCGALQKLLKVVSLTAMYSQKQRYLQTNMGIISVWIWFLNAVMTIFILILWLPIQQAH